MKVTPHPAFSARVTARRGELDFAPKLHALKEDHVWGSFIENVATYAVGDDASAQKLERFANRKSKPGQLMGSLDARGWQKWPDETSLSWAGKTLRTMSGGEASVSLSFFVRDLEFSGTKGRRSSRGRRGARRHRRSTRRIR